MTQDVLNEIASERERQIVSEGWTAEHDDKHNGGELSSAGVSYVLEAAAQMGGLETPVTPPIFWPWDNDWWKPGSTRRNLIKGAALIVAEIQRLDRAEAAKQTPEDA